MQYDIPLDGSLGLLALGWRGLQAWRAKKGIPLSTSPLTPIPPEGDHKRVLLLGWDAADWQVITPLLDAGLMPNLQSLIDRGTKDNLATLSPAMSPMLWTSIATGKRPYKHGIIGFVEPTADGKSIMPVSVQHRRCKALWNILNDSGLRTNVVGWWPSHPAEKIAGVNVSNFYCRISPDKEKIRELTPGTVYPPKVEDFVSELRIHPSELTAAHIQPFVPKMSLVDQSTVNPLQSLARILAENVSIHNAATWAAECTDWDFMAVYYDGIDHFQHGFMKYAPPHQPEIPLQDYEVYKGVITAAYRFHDMMLGRWLKIAGENTIVMLVSDHGFRSGDDRLKAVPDEPAGPAHEHRSHGIFAAAGPGIKKDALIFGSNLLDITPTILHIYGLPVGLDMDGKVLMSIFDDEDPPIAVETWEDGTARKEPGAQEADPVMIERLVELGYIEAPTDEGAALRTIRENRYFLAQSYIDGGKYREARAILEDLVAEDPSALRYSMRLISACNTMLDTPASRSVLEALQSLPKPPPAENLGLIEASILVAEGRNAEALTLYRRIAENPQLKKFLNLSIARCLLRLGMYKEAVPVMQDEIQKDPDSADAWHGLGVCLLKLGDPEGAADCFLEAAGRQFHHALIHYHLGEAWFQLAEYERAEESFLLSLHYDASLNNARKRLVRLYEEFLDAPHKAVPLKEAIPTNVKGTAIVVSGLPRSGTSAMMQMLLAAGVDIFTDHNRKPDISNPRGYLEHEAVLRIVNDTSWIEQTDGKAVKIVAPLLPYLPARMRYKVIFMERDVTEIILSQQKMLGKPTDTIPLDLFRKVNNHLRLAKDWIRQQPHIDVLYIKHRSMIDYPTETARQVADFLELPQADPVQMGKIVDSGLFRSKG